MAVLAGKVMRLGDYLASRIVEQVVHLDDLGRSVGVDWPAPEPSVAVTVAVAIDIGMHRHGGAALVRGLYRDGFGGVFPVF